MKRGFMLSKPFVPLMLVMTGWLVHPFGKSGDVFFFLASWCALLGGIFYWQHQNEIREAGRIKKMLSDLRHEWMNHIQVLMGYLMMKKEEAMKDYFNRLVKQARNERIISNLSYAPLAVALLDIRHRLKEWELSLDVSDQFRFESVEEEKKFLKIWQQLMTMIENRHQQTDAYTGVSFSLEKEENQVRVGVRSNEASLCSGKWLPLLEERLKTVEPSIAIQNLENAFVLTYQLKPNGLGR